MDTRGSILWGSGHILYGPRVFLIAIECTGAIWHRHLDGMYDGTMRVSAMCCFFAFMFQICPAFSQAAVKGTLQELYGWSSQDLSAWSSSGQCLAKGFTAGPKDRKIYSQFGEDGIIDFIFSCINTTDRYYVEFVSRFCCYCITCSPNARVRVRARNLAMNAQLKHCGRRGGRE